MRTEYMSSFVSVFDAYTFALPALLIGFFKNQGPGFIDCARKQFLVRKFQDLIWVSTEDPAIGEVCSSRRAFPHEKTMDRT